MEATRIFLLLVILSFVNCFDFGLDKDFFEDLDGGDKEVKSFFDDSDPGTDDSVFLSESTNKLKDGREMITRESEAWSTDPATGKSIKRKISKHFIRYQNGTVVQVTDQGSGEEKNDKEEATAVECISEEDCNENDYCDRLSFSCKSCKNTNETCHRQKECCAGYICRSGKCNEITGKEGDPCDSDKDCKENHCCAYDEGKDVCKPFLKEGDTCSDGGFLSPRFPSFFTRKFMQKERKIFCPCLKGLECKKQDSYFLMSPKTCERVTKKEKRKKSLRRTKRLRDEMQERRDAIEHEDRIDQNDESDENDDDDDDEHNEHEDEHIDDHDREDDDHDGDDHDDDNRDEDDDDETAKDAIINRIPGLIRRIFGRIFD